MEHLLKRRAVILFWVFTLVFTGLIGHLAYIQVYSGKRLSQQAISQQSQTVALEIPPRGQILDRNLRPLTGDREVWRLVVFPAAVTELAKEAVVLAPILRTNYPEALAYLTGRTRLLPFDLDAEQVAVLNRHPLPGTVLAKVTIRARKPLLAGHLVGYLGKDAGGWTGKMGIESFYNNDLKGDVPNSVARVFLDARGKVIPGLGWRIEKGLKDKDRNNVVLTIDRDIQEIVEKVMDGAGVQDGAVVVSDVRTGDIVAMASRPDFSLEVPRNTGTGYDAVNSTVYGVVSAATYGTVSTPVYPSVGSRVYGTAGNTYGTVTVYNEESYINRCLSLYQPGSVFKVIVAAAALEEGVVNPKTVFLCTGEKDDIVKCYRKDGHGLITFAEAVAYSCNPTFARVGLKLGAKKLIEYAAKFGLDNDSIIGYRTGKANDRLNRIAQPYNLVNASLGQWPVKASVVQITAMMGAIANDGIYMPPRLVREVRDTDGRTARVIEQGRPVRAVTEKTARVIQTMLGTVTKYGTGREALVEPWGSAGKTGSAQVGSEKIDAWFSGYAPFEGPRYAATVLVNNGESGGKTAAPLFREIMQEILKREK
ncbi:MAG: peptidoglycan D,D-transpeptidase FtsI family protein [Eubacteriales bacterium]